MLAFQRGVVIGWRRPAEQPQTQPDEACADEQHKRCPGLLQDDEEPEKSDLLIIDGGLHAPIRLEQLDDLGRRQFVVIFKAQIRRGA